MVVVVVLCCVVLVCWCGVLCCVCMPRSKSLSMVRTQPVLFPSVHSCKHCMEKNWQSSSLVTTVACARLALLVMMHLALCLQMPGMMVDMDQKDGKIWHYTFFYEHRVAPEEYPVLPKSA